MTLRRDLVANRWLRAQFACLIAVVLCAPVMVTVASAWKLLAPAVFWVACLAFSVPAHRLGNALEDARVKADAEARELRTLRAPDAGRNQCPVCGMDDLDALARDDAFMERGVRSKVVSYGRNRAHRDCAELVPYKRAEADRQAQDYERQLRAFQQGTLLPYFICSCNKCGEIGRAKTESRRDAILEEHRKTCWTIPRIELRDKRIG